jgi:N-formylglutamate deformylase
MTHPAWIELTRGDAPLLVSIPHTGTDLLDLGDRLVSPWLARKDADWAIEHLYGFAAGMGATVLRTPISRTVIDVNRDPSGISLYPGQATTGLCPVETFDGEPLYRPGAEPDEAEIAERRRLWFEPYHAVLAAELARLRARHARVVLYDCHSIRSVIPRLFEGELPVFNLGTNEGRSADAALVRTLAGLIGRAGPTWVADGRFKSGWITRHYGRPHEGLHAIQMELACRGYLSEPLGPVDPSSWPVAYDPAFAAPVRNSLQRILEACIAFAETECPRGSP